MQAEPQIAIYPGSFDPLTLGHDDIVRRALKLADGVLIAVAERATHAKQPIVRGLRAVSDFEYEFQMALMNRSLWPEIEIIFMAPATSYTFLSSSLVREVAGLGGDVSEFVPPTVLGYLVDRFGPDVAGI